MFSFFDKLFGEIKTRFNFLNRNNSNSNKLLLDGSDENIVNQAGRDINIGVENNNENISNLETRILNKLYNEYRSTGRTFRWNVVDAYRELEIEDGTYVGLIQDSEYITLDGEHLLITNAGIRYMDTINRR